MSLAEELLADLEDGSDEEEQEELKDLIRQNVGEDVPMVDVKDIAECSSVQDVAKLFNSARLRNVLDKIDHFSGLIRKAEDIQGPVEADPEYLLIVEANNIAAEVDDEIGVLHKFGKDKYSKRFPELETLVVQPLEYLLTAKELKNRVENAKNNKVLEQFLSQATIMVVSVTASTTQGSNLNEAELEVVVECADVAVKLTDYKKKIFEYVESRMMFIAPNLSIIVGASTAAKVMGAAGGLTNLSKMPANNVCLLGQQKKVLSGFSSTTMLPHTGFIYYSEIVQGMPPDLRRKVARVLGSKCTLAARVDSFHESNDGRIGQQFRDEIEKKMEKFQEPPPVKSVKALPTPIEGPRKKRGGRRVRKMKERYAVTELRKLQNRMNFGEIEEDTYQNDLSYNRGLIGKSGVGSSLRRAQIDEKTKVRVSQTLKRNMQKQQATWGGATTSLKKQISGTASSVAFTPMQGLEIVNPQAAERRVDDANAKYFSASFSFMKVNKTPMPPPK